MLREIVINIFGRKVKEAGDAMEEDPWFTVKIMVAIFTGLITLLLLQGATLTRAPKSKSCWLPQKENSAKRSYEIFTLKYTPFWVGCFAVIVGFQLYESFDEAAYFAVCSGLCVPLFLYPFLAETETPLARRYAAKASLWLAVYSFIGNYWYTHYFYSVLRASYTFPSWRLNDVPIPLYFATFFYFSTYHVFSNMALRKVLTTYAPGAARTAFLCSLVFALSYATAFAETLTISGFPYYAFEDRNMAYTVGSVFYGIYFLVSFPMFQRLNEADPFPSTAAAADAAGGQRAALSGLHLSAQRLALAFAPPGGASPGQKGLPTGGESPRAASPRGSRRGGEGPPRGGARTRSMTWAAGPAAGLEPVILVPGPASAWEYFVDALGAGMLILLLLDAVRLALGVPLAIGAASSAAAAAAATAAA